MKYFLSCCPSKRSSLQLLNEDAPVIMHDLKRYTMPDAIWEALATGHVRLVRSSWLINNRGGVLPRRQELPESAFFSVDELKWILAGAAEHDNFDQLLPIVAISFCWASPTHPDPNGHQLTVVANALQLEAPKYASYGFEDMGVFWDWLSIYQKDAQGNRTVAETEGFGFALKQTMDLWYSHQGTTVYMLTELPPDCHRAGYFQSGWTTYERCSAEQIKKYDLQLAKWKLVLDLGHQHGLNSKGLPTEYERRWPTGPDDFDKLVQTLHFTNGADRDTVKGLFRKMSNSQLGGIAMLNFQRMSMLTIDEAVRLGGALRLCDNLQELYLGNVAMSATVIATLTTRLLDDGAALRKCTRLCLDFNYLGDQGVQSFAQACIGGRLLPSCASVDLTDNQIGDRGAQALAEACVMGALPKCRSIFLSQNQVGDVGARALACARKKALPLCKSIDLSGNPASEAVLSVLKQAMVT